MTDSEMYPNHLLNCCQDCSLKVKEKISYVTILPFAVLVLVLGIMGSINKESLFGMILSAGYFIFLAYVYFSLMCWPRTYCELKKS